MPISHVMIKAGASEHAAVVDFYTKALQPLSYEKLKSFPSGITGFGNKSPDLWVAIDPKDSHSTIHFAFQAPDSAAVDAFYAAAIAAGAKDNGPPGLRPGMDPKYYATFIFDPVGNNIEVGCMVE
ncbi:Glyoxalase/Bleomycin resistance protein/Dihydroxybiphenyl dioxygenase [Paraphoma chrysanthemicola]|uniref:Glyoxalase/Bleomycin resistance protein/Dihydroxybiphenyl dioxygenase n=1 Tax=Paraphoma chrysanthemicola TaxID=798071 RepID=A0A8K0W235_9PLEO|nr:Glyoxalase/Bleomycin resistance protein/Dihydroxybiphenyl dioxygenase [Paraphoma chrysanthemicola]